MANGFPGDDDVLLADRRLEAAAGASGEWSLEYDIPDNDPGLGRFAETPGGREFLIRGEVVNRHGPPTVKEYG